MRISAKAIRLPDHNLCAADWFSIAIDDASNYFDEFAFWGAVDAVARDKISSLSGLGPHRKVGSQNLLRSAHFRCLGKLTGASAPAMSLRHLNSRLLHNSSPVCHLRPDKLAEFGARSAGWLCAELGKSLAHVRSFECPSDCCVQARDDVL